MTRISSARVSRSVGGLRVAAVCAAVALAAAGCHSLEVTNPNDPDLQRALATGTDMEALMGGAFQKWFYGMTDIAPSVPASVMSDHYESAWGNWGMKLLGWEPRLYGIVNSTTDSYDDFREQYEEPWYNNYGALVAANLTLKAIANGTNIPGPVDASLNPMMIASARFIQGVTMANIALQFDSGYAFDETYDPAGPALKLVGRDSVERAALTKLDAAISLANGAATPWKIPNTFLNQKGADIWSNTMLAQVANTWAARLIADFPKNAAEDASLASRWATVLTYAQKGISSGTPFDLNSDGDGGNNWYNLYVAYGDEYQVYIRVNYRTVCLMDPAFWCHRPNNDEIGPIPQSADYRFNGDDVVGDNCISASAAEITYGYGSFCSDPSGYGGADYYWSTSSDEWTGYPASRGYWRFSHVANVRYSTYGYDMATCCIGTQPFVLAAENDLLWAEALVNTGGSMAAAAAHVNVTHNGRGHLTDVTGSLTAAQMINAINYEYGVELFATSPMVDWYVNRRRPNLGTVGPALHYYAVANDSDQTGWTPFGTGLQPNSVHLWAVPAKELTLLVEPIYTYGGPGVSEGVAPVGGSSLKRSIFGTTADGRVITGPGKFWDISNALIAQTKSMAKAMKR